MELHITNDVVGDTTSCAIKGLGNVGNILPDGTKLYIEFDYTHSVNNGTVNPFFTVHNFSYRPQYSEHAYIIDGGNVINTNNYISLPTVSTHNVVIMFQSSNTSNLVYFDLKIGANTVDTSVSDLDISNVKAFY